MNKIYSGETTTMTIRVPIKVKEDLEEIGRVTQRSNSFLAQEAIARYLERETRIVAAIQEGLDDIKAGRVVPHEDVMRGARDIVKKARLKKTKRNNKNDKTDLVESITG